MQADSHSIETSCPTYIDHIPVELLARIFLYIDYTSDSVTELPPALLLRSVCRRWHAVAEATQELWPVVVGPYGLEWTRRALALSNDLPLKICLTNSPFYARSVKRLDETLPLIMMERHRIRYIELILDGVGDGDVLDPRTLLALPMPRLAKLEINGPFSGTEYLDESTFGGHIPSSLRELLIDEYPARSTCKVFQTPLTRLIILNCSIWESMGDLLDTLSALMQLEIFDWEIPAWDVPDFVIPLAGSLSVGSNAARRRSVHLGSLMHLRLHLSFEIIAQFFDHVTFPYSCSIKVDIDLMNNPREEPERVCAMLDAALGERLRVIFGDKSNSGFTSLRISEFDDEVKNGVALTWSSEIPLANRPRSYHVGLLPSTESEGFVDPVILDIVVHILKHWPATHRVVSELNVSHWGFASEELEEVLQRPNETVAELLEVQPWAQVLRFVNSVERIHAESNIGWLAEALADQLARGGLPRLRQLDVDSRGLTPTEFKSIVRVLKTGRDGLAEKEAYPVLTLRVADYRPKKGTRMYPGILKTILG